MSSSYESLLRQAGLRATKPRLAACAVLENHPHLEPDELRRRVLGRGVHVSVQAIYDVLNALTGAGIVRRVEPAGLVARYEINHHDNHHHLVCRRCGVIVDVACAAGKVPCQDPVDAHGFVVESAEVIYWGICPGCQRARRAAGASA